MLKTLQKHAPAISMLLLLALIITLFFYKPFARLLSGIIIVFGVGTAVIFTPPTPTPTKDNLIYLQLGE